MHMAITIDKDYNHNFCFAVPEILENDRVLLVPFIPWKHAELFMAQIVQVPDLLVHLPIGPFRDLQHFLTDFVDDRRKDPGFLLFAVYHKSTIPPTFAGIIAMKESSVSHLKTEIGTVVILPQFQRTQIASNAVGLLLHYALDLPMAPGSDEDNKPSALGLRRVTWAANIHNEPSIRFAERLGFRKEGVLRWDRVFPEDRRTKGVGNGLTIRDGDPRWECVGRDTVVFSFCWDDWEDGGREKVDGIMAQEN